MNNEQLNRLFSRIATVLCCMVGVGLFFVFGGYLFPRHAYAYARQDSIALMRLRFEVGLVAGAGLGIFVVVKGGGDETGED